MASCESAPPLLRETLETCWNQCRDRSSRPVDAPTPSTPWPWELADRYTPPNSAGDIRTSPTPPKVAHQRRGGSGGGGGRGKVARRRLDDAQPASPSRRSSNHWGGIKRGIWPHLDCCMITLGSRWKVPIVPELGTEKSSRTSCQIADDDGRLIMDLDTRTVVTLAMGAHRPDASEPGKSSFISTPPA